MKKLSYEELEIAYNSLKKELEKIKIKEKKEEISFDIMSEQLVLYKSIFESMNDGILVLDKNFHYTHWNRAMENMTNISRDELIGKQKLPWEIFPHLVAQQVDEMMKRAINGEIAKKDKIPYKLPNGLSGVTSEVYLPLRGVAGNINGVIGVIRDVTDLIKQKEILLESEARYRIMIENAPEAIVVLDVKKNRFVEINENAEKLFKLNKEDLLKTNPKKLSPEYQPDGRLSSEVASFEIQRAFNGEVPVFEWIHIDSIGNAIPCEIRLVRLPSLGKALIRGSVIDISERKKAENALRESDAKFRSLFHNSNDAIYFLFNGKFELVNKRFMEMLNISLEKVNDSKFNIMNLVADKSKAFIEERENKIIKGEEAQTRYEFTALTKDGIELELEASTSFIEYSGGIATLGILRDVTARKRLEKQLLQAQKMEAIGVLAGGVAHDFNNLLTVINGYSELVLLDMKKKGLDAELYKNIETILNAGKKAENLTGQLLAFSRKQIYKAEIIDLNKIISSMDKMLRRLIGEDINFNMKLTENLPTIMADKSQIDQILINLIVNARDAVYSVPKIDYTKNITIETGVMNMDEAYVSKHHGSGLGKHIYITVSDNGIGMDENTKQKIFDPFYTTKGKFKGTGLGLATVYGIVKQNNGSIYVYSELNSGTMFKIYWPIAKGDYIAEHDRETEIEKITGKENILVVEDDVTVCDFVNEALGSLGYNVSKASNGKLALNLIKKSKINFDLIITDLIMPELGGVKFAEKAKILLPNVKVIYVSGYTDNHIVHNGMLEEGVNFIQKPYNLQGLASYVRNVLDKN